MNMPKSPQDYRAGGIHSARDMLLLGLDAGQWSLQGTLADLSADEYEWEPLPAGERPADRRLPPGRKRVWRVFEQNGAWTYDYTPEVLAPPPFTTIAWIMNHTAQTADMYLYCVRTGLPEGSDRSWDDLPVPAHLAAMKDYLFEALAQVREYLFSLNERSGPVELNKPTPAPWGELRPAYLNLWGGVIEHVLQHGMQIAARKDRIRYGW